MTQPKKISDKEFEAQRKFNKIQKPDLKAKHPGLKKSSMYRKLGKMWSALKESEKAEWETESRNRPKKISDKEFEAQRKFIKIQKPVISI
jgi:hypothetical protein